MGVDKILENAKNAVRKIIPSHIPVTNVEFEGARVVIYTRSMDAFINNPEIVKKMAQHLRRRVAVRTDPELLMGTEEAEEFIRQRIPEEADLRQVAFEENGEVTLEAIRPGQILKQAPGLADEIKEGTGWVPKMVRAPPLPSKTIEEIRRFLRDPKIQDQRHQFLLRTGRRITRDLIGKETWLRFTALGGFQEVGRSCSLMSTRDSKVLIDTGLGVGANEGETPFFSAPELLPLDTLDAVILTHAHLDHSGLIPVLYKYGYKGPIYCTAPTRDMAAMLQLDAIKVAAYEGNKAAYDSSHVREAVMHTIALKFNETTDIAPDIRVTLHNAGHILGSAIAHFHVGDGLYNIAWTGDFKFEQTWLFNPASHRFPRLETIIIESTYGGHKDTQPSLAEATRQLRESLKTILERGGKVIVPVFAVGRSQEVMLVMEDLQRKGEIPEVPIYLDGMIMEATAIHTAYPEYLNNQLRQRIYQQDNPFLRDNFKRIDSREMRDSVVKDTDPCIVLATSGMMNGGPVMEYFRQWADDEKNGMIFVGYQAENTIGRKLQRGAKRIHMSRKGSDLPIEVNLQVITCEGFSGHSDRRQLMRYVQNLEPRPSRIIIGHGELYKSRDLASSIHRKYNIETLVPMNLETIRMR